MRKNILMVLSLTLLVFLLISPLKTAIATPSQQGATIPTPTAGADGRIVYIVQPGDSCWRISAITGVSQDQLKALNKLDADCTLTPGDDLILGFVEKPAATPLPDMTPTIDPSIPTPTPMNNGNATVCILVFDDINGDAVRQSTEVSIPNAAISLTDRLGKISLTKNSLEGTDPVCVEEVPEGDYNISVAVPDGYNPTTAMNYALKVIAGDETYLDFGAQQNSAPAPTNQEEGNNSPLLGIIGGILLIGAIALGVYASRLKK